MNAVMLAELYRPKHVREMVGNKTSRYTFVLRLTGVIAVRTKGLTGKKAVDYAKEKFKEITGEDVEAYAKRAKNFRRILPSMLKSIADGSIPAAALLIGPPGVGKTTLVYAAANDLGRDVFELNASDFRTADKIKKHVLNALTAPHVDPNTFTFKDHIVFLDEVDGLSAFGDIGGASALQRILSDDKKKRFIRYPLVLAANELTTSVYRVKDYTFVIRFYRLTMADILQALKRVLEREIKRRKLDIDPDSPEVQEALRMMAIAANGDLRSALEDLQVFLETRTPHASRKNRMEAARDVVRRLISDRTTTLEAVRLELLSYDDEPDVLIQRAWENISKYTKTPENLIRAYKLLADADLINSRARRGLRSLWRYVNLLTGASLALYVDIKPKRNPYRPSEIEVEYPSRIAKLSKTREERERRKEAFMKAAKILHLSTKKLSADVLPFLRVIALHDPHVLRTIGFPDDVIASLVPESEREEVLKKLSERRKRKRKKERPKEEEKPKKEAKKTEKKEVKKAEKKEEPKKEKKQGSLEDFLGDLIRSFLCLRRASSLAA